MKLFKQRYQFNTLLGDSYPVYAWSFEQAFREVRKLTKKEIYLKN